MPKGVVGISLLCSFFGGRKGQRIGGRGTTWLAGQGGLSPICEVVLLRASIVGVGIEEYGICG